MRTRPWLPPILRDPNDGEIVISPRMAQVLSGMAEGLSNRQIGSRLFLSEQTIKTHAKRLFLAIGAKDRAHAVAIAMSGQVKVLVREEWWQ